MNKKETTIDDLARMVADGFNGVHKEISGFKEEVGKRFDEVYEIMGNRFDKVEGRLGNLEQGQEEIKTVIGNAATKFEVRELDRRVHRLEKKAGIA